MADKDGPEQSMEEILASIGRIVNSRQSPSLGDNVAAVVSEISDELTRVGPPTIDAEDQFGTNKKNPSEIAALGSPSGNPSLVSSASSDTSMAAGAMTYGAGQAPPSALSTPAPDQAPPVGEVTERPPSVAEPSGVSSSADDVAASKGEDMVILSARVIESAASEIGRLKRTIATGGDNRTIEAVVSELLAPRLDAWLSDNLPRVVQMLVQAEIDRIVGRPATTE